MEKQFRKEEREKEKAKKKKKKEGAKKGAKGLILGELQLVNTRFTLHSMQPSAHTRKKFSFLRKSFIYKRNWKNPHEEIGI
jgi:hypothetical protein